MAVDAICTVCGHYGPARKHTKGSIVIEIALWLLMIVPGLLYSLWRLTSKEKVCAECGSNSIVPETSPVGQRLLAEQRDAQRRAIDSTLDDPDT
jgi:hypothetical protein